MANLILTYKNLYDRVSKFLGSYGSTGATGAELEQAKQAVDDGYRRFLTSHDWSFLKKTTTLGLKSGKWEYNLPDDYRAITVPFHFSEGSGYPPLTNDTEDHIMQARTEVETSSYPQIYAERTSSYSPEHGTVYQVIFWPTPDSDYTLFYTYKFMPPAMSNDSDVPVGLAEMSELIKEMCLAEAEAFFDDDAPTKIHDSKASQLLDTAIRNDVVRHSRHAGSLNTGSVSAREFARGSYRVNNVVYNT